MSEKEFQAKFTGILAGAFLAWLLLVLVVVMCGRAAVTTDAEKPISPSEWSVNK